MKKSMNLAIVLTALTLTFSDAMASDLKARTENLERQMIELNQIHQDVDFEELARLQAEVSEDLMVSPVLYRKATTTKGCCGDLGRVMGNITREAGRGVSNVIREGNRGINNMTRELGQANQVWENIKREATKAYNDLRVLTDKIVNIQKWTEAARDEIKKGGGVVIQISGNIIRESGTAVVKIQAVAQQVQAMGIKGVELVVYSKISRSILPNDLIEVAQLGLESFKLQNDIFVLAVNESMRLTKFPGYLHNKAYNLCMAESVYKDIKNYALLGEKDQKDRAQACFDHAMVEFDKNEQVSPEEYEQHKKRVAEMEAQTKEEKRILAESQEAQVEKDRILAEKDVEKQKLERKLALLAKYQEELKKVAEQAEAIKKDTEELLIDL